MGMMDMLEKISSEGRCCATGKSLNTSKYTRMVTLYSMTAKWPYPISGNVLTGVANRAVAFVHDEAIDEDGYLITPIVEVVEFRDNQIIYHPYVADRSCRVCGCTEDNCKQCVEKTGKPCHWVEEDLCSACYEDADRIVSSFLKSL